MNKIILMCPSYSGYGEKIKKVMEKIGYEVLYIPHDGFVYKYKNIFEKIKSNIIYKIFLRKNFKKIKEKEILYKRVEDFGSFNGVVVIRPDFYDIEFIKFLKAKNAPMVLHFWDSISYKPEQKKYIEYFDYLYSFDKKEAKEYEMEFLPNFYMKDEIKKSQTPKYDVFTVMSYDERFEELENLAKKLKERSISYKFIVVTKKDINSDYIEIRKNTISLEKMYEYYSKSKVVVEIGHNTLQKQGGLSFRAIDALGNRKKLITTYELIKEYDFYNPNNIMVLEKEYTIDIEFFKKEYEDIKEDIYIKYRDEEWVKRLIENIR
ncbi:MAG: hypothetical protein ACRC8F_02115 [Cetobacterium sp.]